MKINNLHQFNVLIYALEHVRAHNYTHPELPLLHHHHSALFFIIQNLQGKNHIYLHLFTRWIISEVFCNHFEHLMNTLYMSPQRIFPSICFLFITLYLMQCWNTVHVLLAYDLQNYTFDWDISKMSLLSKSDSFHATSDDISHSLYSIFLYLVGSISELWQLPPNFLWLPQGFNTFSTWPPELFS